MSEAFFDPERELITERLALVPPRDGTEKEYYRKIAADPDVTRCYVIEGIQDENDPILKRILEGFTARKQYFFAITDRETGEFYGAIHQCGSPSPLFPNVEIGYALGKAYWNRGIMTEALGAFIGLMFEKGVHKVTAEHFTENPASGRVMEKCGMIREGTKVSEIFYRGGYHDFETWYLLNPAEPEA